MESFEQVSSKPARKSRANRSVRLVVLGMMGRMPLAGLIWQVLHYLEGFRRLGFEVYYVEDTSTWSYNPAKNASTDDCTYALDVISRSMASFGFAERWAYRSVNHGGRFFGLSNFQVRQLFEQADILINLTASTSLHDEHLRVPIRVYLETDPVLPQIEIAKGNPSYLQLLGAHTHHFSYGENLGGPDCGVPVQRFHYRPTRQPVVIDWWTDSISGVAGRGVLPPGAPLTTIANWRQSNKDLEWNGERYTWSKHYEFMKVIDLPKQTSQSLELALALNSGAVNNGNKWSGLGDEDTDTVQLLLAHGWRVVNALRFSTDIISYRDYISHSRGELTVAKDQNIRLRTGWFSDRSACYLASGRPVITQETGFSKFIPTGHGLFAFNTLEEILEAVREINADYPHHCQAAHAIALDHFSADRVLSKLVQDVGL